MSGTGVGMYLNGASVELSLSETDVGVYLSSTSVGVSAWDRSGCVLRM